MRAQHHQEQDEAMPELAPETTSDRRPEAQASYDTAQRELVGMTRAGEAPETSSVTELDETITTALRRDDRRTAVALCARHHGAALGRLCVALLGSQSEAEDVLQETLIDAYHGFGGYRSEGTVRAWLYAIARRKCARHLEQRARRTARLAELPVDGAKDSASDEQVAADQRAARARELMASARPSEREALLLRYGAGLSYRELGAALGIDETTARKRVSRALGRLRDVLNDGRE